MAASVTELIRRYQALKAQRTNYDVVRQDIADYIDPYRGQVTRQITPGDKRTTFIYDSTAPKARKLLASTLHYTLTPSTQPWLSLAMRQEELNRIKEVRDWLEQCSERLSRAFKASNFGTAVHEMYNDLVGAAATGCLFVEEADATTPTGAFAGFRFRAHPPAEYYVAEDAEGRVDTVFRELRPSARAALNKWGDDVGEVIANKAKTRPDEPVLIVHAVYPRTDRVYMADGRTPKRGARNMPVASCYFVPDTKHRIDEGGFEESPFMVPRWDKASGEVYGNGPSHLAIPDVRTLNAAVEYLLRAAPLAMFPPTVERDDSVVGELDLSPSGRNVVSGSGAIADNLGFMQTGLKIDLTQIVLGDLRNAILETYFIPQLRLKDSPQMTATEVQARLEEMYRYLGPTLARLEAEFLNPLVQRCFGIMARAHALPAMPDVLREALGEADLDVEYEGPLARAQRTIELTARERTVAFATALLTAKAQFPDPAWDVLKVDDMVRAYAETAGMPSDEIEGEEQVQAIREQRAKVQAEQQQAAQMMEAAKAAGAAAPMMKELREGSMAQMEGVAA